MDRRKIPGKHIGSSNVRSKSNLGEKNTNITGGLKSNVFTRRLQNM